MATILEVAKQASVSIATVSNVIRGTKRVSPELEERVRAAMEELDYSPNAIARGLKARQTHLLGLVLPDITNPFFPGIIRGAEDTAFDRGYFLVTANTDEQVGRERRMLGALRSYRADGILLASAPGTDIEYIRRTIASGVAMVVLDRPVAGVKADAVLLDNVRGARECVRHLLQLGHRRIAIVTGPLALQNARERLQGYEEAIREFDIAMDPSLVLQGDYRMESGERTMKDLLKRRTGATAVFVCNGVMTIGVLKAAEEAGVQCPRDISIATFDDLSLDHSSHPHLTVVVQPSYDMGSRAATLLLDRIEGRITGDPIVVRVVPTLIRRESTSRPQPAGDRQSANSPRRKPVRA
jgi:LacI family transcriptional regulator